MVALPVVPEAEQDQHLFDETEFDARLDLIEECLEKGVQPPFECPDEERAEAHLRAYRYWADQNVALDAKFSREVTRLTEWYDKERNRLTRRSSWSEANLKRFLWESGATVARLVNGTLRRRKGSERVVIDDDASFLAQHDGSDFVRATLTLTPDKTAIKAWAKAHDGEPPAGASIERSEDAFKIDLPEETEE
jgi:hypothetical protein